MSENNESNKFIVNAHIGKTNVIDNDNINKILYHTFDTIGDVLSNHCGPYGRFAMIPDPNNPLSEPTFTKDGINIIKAMEFVSPMERYIKDTVAYIGNRVEKAGGDGTTSSMIIAVEVLWSLRTLIENNNIHYSQLVDEYQNFIDIVISKLKENAITDITSKSKEELRNIAFHQAMTSSHGHETLSNIIADLFVTFPEDCWRYITFKKESKETKDLYSMEWDDSDYTAKASIFSNSLYNNKYGTGYEIEDTTLIVVPHDMARDSADYLFVKNSLVEAIEKSEKLAVIVANNVDPVIRTELETVFDKGKRNPGQVVLFFMNAHTPIFNDLNAICALMGKHHYESTIDYPRKENVKITLESGIMRIWGLVDPSTIVDNSHPDWDNPQTPVGSLIQMCTEGLERTEASHMNTDIISEFRRIYNTLRLVNRGQLVIGGSAYDNQAALDVVQDTLKATRATLREGAGLGGYGTLHATLSELLDYNGSYYFKELCLAFIKGIDKVRENSLKRTPEKYFITTSEDCDFELTSILVKHSESGENDYVDISELTKDPRFINYVISKKGYVFNVLNGFLATIDDVKSTDMAVILQPISVDQALLKRFGEVALKFLFTERIVVPGGVVVNDNS